MYAEEWMDEEFSSYDKEMEDKGLMAYMEEEKMLSQFEIDLKKVERISCQAWWNKASTY